ncbi:protein phosphatase 2C domain-containing protein [Acaryochloris sp. IP29b_bin.148]|uniref:protein phosphatase 2C domain-containing protein n=1 Tax=Acaryochloris sp. IP29b_bin.148 TaxID=2969218 RepID=UPI00262BE267|nr:protein phosphatase 2C domain-containing protein [Acaryochloris sp. IP29b_bin.148]
MDNLVYIFSIPKEGESQENNQDAACCNDGGTLLAIADGVSSSLFSKEWAQILTRKFCQNTYISLKALHKHWYYWLHPLQEDWRNFYLSKVASLPWYAKGSTHKDHGSATFLGLKIHKYASNKGYWEAISIGDSCLFQIHPKEKKISSYPQIKSHEFSSVSVCTSSLPEYNSRIPNLWTGEYDKGDYFILATDAIAQWIVKSLEEQKFDENFTKINNSEQFSDYIDHLRVQKEIHNDDTSIVLAFPKRCSITKTKLYSNNKTQAINQQNKFYYITNTKPIQHKNCQSENSQKTIFSKFQRILFEKRTKIATITSVLFLPCRLYIYLLLLVIMVVGIFTFHKKHFLFEANFNKKSGYIEYFITESRPYRIYQKKESKSLSETLSGVLWFKTSDSGTIWLLAADLDFELATKKPGSNLIRISQATPIYEQNFDLTTEYYPIVGYLFKGSYFYETREKYTDNFKIFFKDTLSDNLYWVKIKLEKCKKGSGYSLSHSNTKKDKRKSLSKDNNPSRC